MLDYIKDNKAKVSLLFLGGIGFLIYIFYPKDEYVMEMVKPSQPHIQKVEIPVKAETPIKTEVIQNKKIVKKAEEKVDNVLFTSSDSTSRYKIKLINVNNIKIEKKGKYSTRYVPLSGELEDNLIKSKFTLSISEDLLDYVGDLVIKVEDTKNKDRQIETPAYFLSVLDINSSYKAKLTISGDTLYGEIKTSEKMPDFILQQMGNDEPIVINVEEHNKGLKPLVENVKNKVSH